MSRMGQETTRSSHHWVTIGTQTLLLLPVSCARADLCWNGTVMSFQLEKDLQQVLSLSSWAAIGTLSPRTALRLPGLGQIPGAL